MSQSAQVHSLDAIRRLHDVLARFGAGAQEALALADREVRRVHDELADRLRYWRQQIDRRHEEVARARAALSHARATSDGRGGVEQELELAKAQRRLREAEEKLAAVRRWQRELPEVTKDYEGRSRSLAGFLDGDLRQALALLQNKSAVLEAYASVARPGLPAAPTNSVTQPKSEDPT